MGGDVLEAGDDVHVGAVGNGETFPSRGFIGSILSPDVNCDDFLGGIAGGHYYRLHI